MIRTSGQFTALVALSHIVAARIELLEPPRWTAANDTKRPPSGKDRSKVKAARKQRNKK